MARDVSDPVPKRVLHSYWLKRLNHYSCSYRQIHFNHFLQVRKTYVGGLLGIILKLVTLSGKQTYSAQTTNKVKALDLVIK